MDLFFLFSLVLIFFLGLPLSFWAVPSSMVRGRAAETQLVFFGLVIVILTKLRPYILFLFKWLPFLLKERQLPF